MKLIALAALAALPVVSRAQAPEAAPQALLRALSPSAAEGDRLVDFGVEVSRRGSDLVVDHVLPGSEAARLGLAPGDVLLDVAGVPVKDAASVAKAVSAFKPETRQWAVVRRGGAVTPLETELPRIRVAGPRGPDALSPMEAELARRHAEEAKGREEEAIRSLVTPRLEIGPGQRTWVQFPAGLAAELKAGDVVEGLVTTGLAADASLDYLAIPPRSQVWAEVADASASDGVRTLRLHVFKLKLDDGHFYPVSARVVDLTGDRVFTQVSPGGTIVSADPAGLGPDTKAQVELLEPLTLYEAPNYYKAGVGLWLKQRGSGAERQLEVSHVIAGRSAERAGIQVGDVVIAVDGTTAAKLDFVEAMDRLYGAPGTNVSVRVQRGSAVVEGGMNLTRGVRYRSSVGIEVDWADKGPGLLVAKVAEDSPAAKAGVKAGDRLVRFGKRAVGEIPMPKLKEILLKDLVKDNEATVKDENGFERPVPLQRDMTRTTVAPPFKT